MLSSEVLKAVPKSILKRSPVAVPAIEPLQATPREARNLELALQHANLIQQRKDFESSILEATEILLDFPLSEASNSAQLSSQTASRVKELLRSFRPADYDSLVEERNIDGRCGYVLCSKPHRVENTSAKYRILRAGVLGGKGINIVEKAELERWCSDECGKRALFIRVQLSEVPAWERLGWESGSIEIYDEKSDIKASRKSEPEDLAAMTEALKQLAIERGGKGTGIGTATIEATVHERDVRGPGREASTQNDDYHESARVYGSVEGYIPKAGGSRARRKHWDDELQESGDLMDII